MNSSRLREADMVTIRKGQTCYRAAFLEVMVRHVPEVSLRAKDGQPDELLFRTIAEIPMECMEAGVTYEGPPFDVGGVYAKTSGRVNGC